MILCHRCRRRVLLGSKHTWIRRRDGRVVYLHHECLRQVAHLSRGAGA